MKSLAGSVVVVTGASSGIGLETARAFAAAGSRVALLARKAEALSRATVELGNSAAVKSWPVDVTRENDVATAFAAIAAEWGGVDVLVNCAGVGFATDLASCALEDYRRIFETNVTGAFLCCRAVLPAMTARRSGHIINVSSVAGKIANPNAPLYCASKSALNGYTAGLQQQVAAANVRVSLVSPSAVDTAYWNGRTVDRTKFLRASEVAAVIHFVACQPDGVLIKDVDLTALR